MRLQIIALGCLLIIMPLFGIEKMVYGSDDRQEVNNYPIRIFRDLANSTAGAIRSSMLKKVGFSKFEIEARTLGDDLNLCSENRFTEQLTAAQCSGVLIAKDKILTAGHCVQDFEACSELSWVFGFEHDTELLNANQVYSCKKIVAFEIDDYTQMDYAIVQLDRPVTGRDPVFFTREVKIEAGDEMVVIGHPSGLPLKIADNGFVRDEKADEVFFQTNLDTFIFNSGSPVYDKATARLQGILVRGDTDYSYDFNKGCTILFEANNDDGRGEDVIKINSIPDLEKYLD